MESILTTQDVAKLLRLSKSTVYKYAEDGKIPSVKVGKSRRFLPGDIQAYLQSLKQPIPIQKEDEKNDKKTTE
jgi:PTS system nitrogen regulatory IIA component